MTPACRMQKLSLFADCSASPLRRCMQQLPFFAACLARPFREYVEPLRANGLARRAEPSSMDGLCVSRKSLAGHAACQPMLNGLGRL